MTTPDELPTGTVIDGRFRVERRHPDGTYAAVALAHGRPVRITLLPPGGEPAPADAKAILALAHPQLVAPSELGEHAGRTYLVADEVAGETLAERLRGGRLSVAATLGLARDILAGLAHAHALGVLHARITPGDIIIHGNVARLRFSGLPRPIGEVELAAADQVATGGLRGTPEYMAPEQALGGVLDARTDLYALSVVLYEMLAGRTPFSGREPLGVLNQHVNTPVPAMSGGKGPSPVPPEVEAVVRCGLAKDPAERQQSAAEYKSALVAARTAVNARDADSTIRMAESSAHIPRLLRASRTGGDGAPRRPGLGAVIVIALLVGGGYVAYRLLRRPPPTTVPTTAPTTAPGAPALAVPTHPTPSTADAAKAAPVTVPIDAAPAPETAAPAGSSAATGPWQAELDAARASLRAHQIADARARLVALRKQYPDVGEIHKAMGEVFRAKNWPAETLAAYRAAIAADPALRTDPSIIAGAISLLDSNSRWWDAARFLQRDVDARAQLAVAAERDLTPIIRERARDVLAKLK